MPTYEYQCQQCRKRQETSQSITAKPLTKCQKCGGRLKRLISSGSGFLFKGSGFYITDYRSKSYHEAKKKDQPKSSSGASLPAPRDSDVPSARQAGLPAPRDSDVPSARQAGLPAPAPGRQAGPASGASATPAPAIGSGGPGGQSGNNKPSSSGTS